ncbi:metallophosphoesterase [Candidatus Moduliflexus flocculans]|uniref:Metallophosphoesterase n=1 Tax=Candidatus Moduliflexus flocculans TaxID=1499966 RepID=A0A081BS59_9BACT|nr:metallophosphoesterase [Candidatus Moduliflexus flocculans]
MSSGDTIVIADAHLDGVNRELRHFLSLLESFRAQKIASLVLLGDIFNFWVGTSKMTLPCHAEVLNALTILKMSGVSLTYVEGNRDYFLARQFLHAPFHAVSSEGIRVEIAGRQWYFSHGDLVNIHDRQYRNWRRFSRNSLLFAAFNAMPQALTMWLAHAIEKRLRVTNRRYKSAFPVAECYEYAEMLWQQGCDMIVLGHFHQERRLERSAGDHANALLVLPAWKDSHRFLRISFQGDISLESSEPQAE